MGGYIVGMAAPAVWVAFGAPRRCKSRYGNCKLFAHYRRSVGQRPDLQTLTDRGDVWRGGVMARAEIEGAERLLRVPACRGGLEGNLGLPAGARGRGVVPHGRGRTPP